MFLCTLRIRFVSIITCLFVILNFVACSNQKNQWENNTAMVLNSGLNNDFGYYDFASLNKFTSIENVWFAVKSLKTVNKLNTIDQLKIQKFLNEKIDGSNIADIFYAFDISRDINIKINNKDEVLKWLILQVNLDGSVKNTLFNKEAQSGDKLPPDFIANISCLKLLSSENTQNTELINKMQNNLSSNVSEILNGDNYYALYEVFFALKQSGTNLLNVKNFDSVIKSCKNQIQKLETEKIDASFLASLYGSYKLLELCNNKESISKDMISKIMSLRANDKGFSMVIGEKSQLMATYFSIDIINSESSLSQINIDEFLSYIQRAQAINGGFYSGVNSISDIISTCATLYCLASLKKPAFNEKESLKYVHDQILNNQRKNSISYWRENFYGIQLLQDYNYENIDLTSINKQFIETFNSNFKNKNKFELTEYGSLFYCIKTFKLLNLPLDRQWCSNIQNQLTLLLQSINDETPNQVIYYAVLLETELGHVSNELSSKIEEAIFKNYEPNSKAFTEGGMTNSLSTLRSVQILKCINSKRYNFGDAANYLNTLKVNDGGYCVTAKEPVANLGTTFIGFILSNQITQNQLSLTF